MGQFTQHTLFISLLTALTTLSLSFPLHNLRSLDPKSAPVTIEIPIRADGADYRLTTFDDPSSFYCEKTQGPLGVNDVCTLQPSRLTLSKSMDIKDLASTVSPVGDRLVFYKENQLYVYGLQTDFDRPRMQLLSTLSLTLKNENFVVNNVYFDNVNQYVVALKQSKVVLYKLNGIVLEKKAEAKESSINENNFQDKRIFYFKDKYVVSFDRNTSTVKIYTINDDSSLSLQKQIENCQDVYVDSKYVFAFTQDKIKAFNGEEEMIANFEYKIKSLRKSYSSGVLVYAENLPGNTPESVIYNVECFGKNGFRIEQLLNCPKNGKAIYLTSKSLYIVYENWVRVYPIFKDKEFNQVYSFDFVFSTEVFGVLVSQGQEYLVLQGDLPSEILLLVNERSNFALECKKEKGSEIVEYTFKVRCISMKCDGPEIPSLKYNNGSCSYTKQIRIYPEDENGTIGVALLVGLGFVAGIAITMGLGVFNCFGKTSKESVKAHSPRDKRFFGRNRSMRRQYTAGSRIIETTATLPRDESYVSEDNKDNVINSLTPAKKKSSQTIFETPRFISFASTTAGGHTNEAAHSNIGYLHIESSDHANDGSEIKTSGEDADTPEGKDMGQVKVEKLKLGDRVIVKDPASLASFRKELASFRDMVITNVIPEEEQKEETTERHNVEKYEGKHEGKYQAFRDEEEEEEDDDDDIINEKDANELGIANINHGDSFSK